MADMWETSRARRVDNEPGVRRFPAPTPEQLTDIPWDDLAEELLS